MTKEEQLISRFNKHHGYVLALCKNSSDYKYYKQIIDDMIATKQIVYLERVRNVIKLELKRCYANEARIKKRCVNQCSSCQLLQKQKETLINQVEQIIDNKRLKDKLKSPNKLTQIIKILLK
jgi:hypothetical protein